MTVDATGGRVLLDPDDTDSFTRVVREHDRRLRGLAFRLLAGDASRLDDVMQDAYLSAFRALARFRHDADPGSWLYRITYNACMDELRRAKRRPVPLAIVPGTLDESPDPGPEREVVASHEVARALADLSPEHRAVVVLVDGEGLDLAAAAALLEVPTGTVKSRLSRARAAMRTALGEEY
jgi:RNA polymerase sigma-70 factor (ECF subfamily)